jgi:hypothetical protein
MRPSGRDSLAFWCAQWSGTAESAYTVADDVRESITGADASLVAHLMALMISNARYKSTTFVN